MTQVAEKFNITEGPRQWKTSRGPSSVSSLVAATPYLDFVDEPIRFYEKVVDEAKIEDEISNGAMVVGNNSTEIQTLLELHFPCPHPECTLVYRECAWRFRTTINKGHYTYHEDVSLDGWAILDKPLCLSDDPAVWAQTSIKVGGPIYVGDYPSERERDNNGLTLREFRHSECLHIVNFNPPAIKHRPRRQAMREYKRRTERSVPQEILHSLMYFMCQWPLNDHPLSLVRHPRLHNQSGWGTRARVWFSVKELMEMRDLVLRLDRKNKYWRTCTGHGAEHNNFETALICALEYVHGREWFVANAREEQYQEDLEGYASYRDVWYHHLDSRGTKKPLKFKHWCGKGRKNEWDLDIAFCRWLRSEARAMKIPMPAKPKKPAKLKKKKAKRKARKKGKETKNVGTHKKD